MTDVAKFDFGPTIACLLLGATALASCCFAWRLRFSLAEAHLEMKRSSRVPRDSIALSALSCATASTAGYLGFVVLWVYSGRQNWATAVIVSGVAFSAYALVGGFFARGTSRFLITVSALAASFLWYLALLASAAA